MQGSHIELKKKLKQTWKSFGIHRGYQEPTSPSTPVQRGKENIKSLQIISWGKSNLKENIKSLQIISRGKPNLKENIKSLLDFHHISVFPTGGIRDEPGRGRPFFD